MDTTKTYESIASELKDRILALIPAHPEILDLESAWGLRKIEGFECGDLNPSAAQAGWAINQARLEWDAAGGASGGASIPATEPGQDSAAEGTL